MIAAALMAWINAISRVAARKRQNFMGSPYSSYLAVAQLWVLSALNLHHSVLLNFNLKGLPIALALSVSVALVYVSV